ncbi:MAG: DUF2461 domain-containing protein [Bacteroidetes bacterium]|nr:MAG: DUF2461 domain-containing protein [Bacteroidota bacterium]
MSVSIHPDTIPFLRALKANNERDWFAAHKARYQTVYNQFKAFAKAVEDQVSQHDVVELVKVYRIYRDIRFSKDKSPYKGHLSGSFTRATALRRGGYYFHIEPGKSFAGGGFWGPDSSDLKRIRQEIAANPDELRTILTAPEFVKVFGELRGDRLKTAPQGYPKDHPAIDLLRYKQYLLLHEFSDQEAQAPDFAQKIAEVFAAMRPFLDYMTDILTTDENGVPIV